MHGSDQDAAYMLLHDIMLSTVAENMHILASIIVSLILQFANKTYTLLFKRQIYTLLVLSVAYN